MMMVVMYWRMSRSRTENIEGYKNENTGVIPTTSKEKFTIGVGSVKLYPPGAKELSDTWLHGGFCKYCNAHSYY